MTEQQPYQILTPRDALIESAKLNQQALMYFNDARRDSAVVAATVALSLSTYALASYQRDGGGGS